MGAALRLLGTLLILAGMAGLALLAAGPPGNGTGTPVADLPRETAQPTRETVRPTDVAHEVPTPEVAVRETPTRDTAQPTPDAAVTSTRLLLDEEFVDNRMHWPHDPQATAWLGNPGYRLVARYPGQFVAVRAPIPVPLGDVVVTATFRKLGGPPGGGYGLIVRDQHTGTGDGIGQGGRYFVLEVGDRGQIGIWRRDDVHWTDLLTWTDSDAVHQGSDANTLEVWATGQRLTLLVNGVQVASAIDPSLTAGGVGVFAGGDGNDVQIDRLQVRVPDGGPLTTAVNVAASAAAIRNQQPAGPTRTDIPPPAPTATPIPFRPITRVVIPSISLDAPSVLAGLVKRDGAVTWDVPPFKIGHAQETAGAGAAGNAVLVGHVTSRNLGNVFERLHQVGIGDSVQIFSQQRRFDYRVVDVRTVARSDVSVVQQTASPLLTLITCSGPWLPLLNDYAERLTVRAELERSE